MEDAAVDGLAGAILTMSAHPEVGLFQPVDNLAYLGVKADDAEGDDQAPAPGTTDGFNEDDELWADTVTNVKRMKAEDREKLAKEKEMMNRFRSQVHDSTAFTEQDRHQAPKQV